MDEEALIARIRRRGAVGNFVPTPHADAAMKKRLIDIAEVSQALANAEILELYPGYVWGPCCLVVGVTQQNRYIHAVCTMSGTLRLATVYEPEPPQWVTPKQRGQSK
jgi:Domain of unknown function (DUF4258)